MRTVFIERPVEPPRVPDFGRNAKMPNRQIDPSTRNQAMAHLVVGFLVTNLSGSVPEIVKVE